MPISEAKKKLKERQTGMKSVLETGKAEEAIGGERRSHLTSFGGKVMCKGPEAERRKQQSYEVTAGQNTLHAYTYTHTYISSLNHQKFRTKFRILVQ